MECEFLHHLLVSLSKVIFTPRFTVLKDLKNCLAQWFGRANTAGRGKSAAF